MINIPANHQTYYSRSRDENELLVCPAYSSKTSSATPDAAPSARIKILSAF